MSHGTQNAPDTATQIAPESAAPFWQPIWQFAVHAVVGTIIFAIIAALAVALEVGVHKLRRYGIGGVIAFGLQAGEYTLFGVDLTLFGIFLWRDAKRTINQL